MTVAALVFNEFIDDLREKIAMGDHVPTPELIEVKRCTSPVDWADIMKRRKRSQQMPTRLALIGAIEAAKETDDLATKMNAALDAMLFVLSMD